MKKTILAKTLIASAITFSIGTVAAAPYEIIDLGKVEGGNNSFAYGLNNSGEAVGFGNGPIITNEDGLQFREFSSHALHFINGEVIDLGVLANGSSSLALSINNNGISVGTSDESRTIINDNGDEVTINEDFAVAFQSGAILKLNNLEGYTFTQATGINDNNIVIGLGLFDVDPEDQIARAQRGFIYDLSSDSLVANVAALSPEASRQSYPLSINNNGLIAGWAEKEVDGILEARAFWLDLQQPEVLNELPTIDTSVTMARDINDNGVIIGFVQSPTNRTRNISFVFDSNSDTELTRIPFFENQFDDSIANAINNNDQIVGQALVSSPSIGQRAGYLFENNELKNLNDMIPCDSGWIIDNATNINDNGEIVGFGLRTETVDEQTTTEIRAFKLMPTGGAIEICDDGSDDNNDSSGGSWSLTSMLLLGLVFFRRKYFS